MSEIAEGQRGGSTETVLSLQAPFLILRRVIQICWRRKTWGNEKWICSLNLGQRLAVGKPCHESGMKSGRVLGQAVVFAWGKGIAVKDESADVRRIVKEVSPLASRYWIIEDPDSSAQHGIARNTEGLPRKTEPRSPYEAISVEKCMLLIGNDRLVVGLLRIVINRTERPMKSEEAVSLANRV